MSPVIIRLGNQHFCVAIKVTVVRSRRIQKLLNRRDPVLLEHRH